jgi:hypothetical protein
MGNQPVLFLVYLVVGWFAVILLSTLVFALVEKPISLAKRPERAQPGI